jgi:hypothetical protein
VTTTWGLGTDIAVPGDFDGDGRTDLAVYRPSSGTWYFLYAKNNFTTSASAAWGTSTDRPMVGDYDGDGKADLALFSGGTWKILFSGANYTTSVSVGWGLASDVPLPVKPW